MAKNEFLPVATGVGANALTPAEYAGAAFRQQGFQAGTARSSWHNAVFRQSSTWAAILGQFTADYGNSDVLDDGDLEKLQGQFEAALKIALDVPLENERWHFADDESTSANRLVVNIPDLKGDVSKGFALGVIVKNRNTGPTQISINGQPDLSVTRAGGLSLYNGDIVETSVAVLVHDGTRLQLINPLTFGEIAGLPTERKLWHYGRDNSDTANTITATVDDFGLAYFEGLQVAVRVRNNNTGATKINLNGKGLVPLNIGQSTPLNPNDAVDGTTAYLCFDPDGVSAQLINPQTALSGNGSGGGGGGGTIPPNWNDITGPLAAYWLTVLSNTMTDPPASPATGATYLVPHTGATGVWATNADRLTMWTGSTWVYRTYPKGSVIGVQPTGSDLCDLLERTDTGWVSKFATPEDIAAGLSKTKIVSPSGLKDAGIGQAFIYVNGPTTVHAGAYLVDTSGGPFTLTLPADPATGTVIRFADSFDAWGPNPPTLARNGQTIMGFVDDLVCNVPGALFSIWFSPSELTWKLV